MVVAEPTYPPHARALTQRNERVEVQRGLGGMGKRGKNFPDVSPMPIVLQIHAARGHASFFGGLPRRGHPSGVFHAMGDFHKAVHPRRRPKSEPLRETSLDALLRRVLNPVSQAPYTIPHEPCDRSGESPKSVGRREPTAGPRPRDRATYRA